MGDLLGRREQAAQLTAVEQAVISAAFDYERARRQSGVEDECSAAELVAEKKLFVALDALACGLIQDDRSAAEWRERAFLAVKEMAYTVSHLTSDDIFAAVGSSPGDGRAVAYVLSRAAGAGLIKRTEEEVRSKRASAHGRRHRVWRSLVFLK